MSRLLALLLLALALAWPPLPARGQETATDPENDGKVELPLPFLARDGEERRDAVCLVPVLPVLHDDGLSNATPTFEKRKRAFAEGPDERPWAFPRLDALLDVEGVKGRIRAGKLELRADSKNSTRDRGRTLLAAVASAYERKVRMELVVVWAGSGGLSDAPPEALLDTPPPGTRVALRVNRVLTEGAVAWTDERADRTFPARFDIDPWAVYTRPVTYRTGVLAGVSACWAGRREVGSGIETRQETVWLARVGFHVTDVVNTRRLEHPPLVATPPRVRFASAALDVPVVPGKAHRFAAGGDGGFVAVVRVTPVAIPSAPAGTRAYGAHDRGPLFASDADHDPGVSVMSVDDDPATGWESADRTTVVPEAWRAVAKSVRLAAVEPGVIVATGPEADLARLDSVVQRTRFRETAPRRLRVLARGEPLVDVARHGRHPGFVAWGLLEPVAVEADAEIASDNGFTITNIENVATGGRLTWSTRAGETVVRVRRIDLHHAADTSPTEHAARRTSWSVRESQVLKLDDLRLRDRTATRRFPYDDDGPGDGTLVVTDTEWSGR